MNILLMNVLKLILVTALFVLVQTAAVAQDWVSYQSPNQVNDLVDSGGELFLATDAGLVVVDKATLAKTIYTTSNSNLTNNHIQTITQSATGSIWIGTYDVVVARFTGADFTDFTTVDNAAVDANTQLYDLQLAPNGDFWLGTSDGVFQRQGQDWIRYGASELGPSFFEAWDIAINDAGEVFMASIDVHKFADGAWTNLTAGTEVANYLGADLFISSTGDLFDAGDLSKIGRFDGQTWQTYPVNLNGSEVVKFTEDIEGNIYFNTQRNGIFKLENGAFVQQETPQTIAFGNITPYFHIDDQDNRWMNKNIRLSVDRDGAIETTLIADHTLEANSIRSIHQGKNEKTYFIVSSQDNISVVDANGNWSFLPKPPMASPFEFLNDLLVLADDNIYLAAQTGLYQYNGTEWSFTELGFCRSIDIDSQGKIYIASDFTIYILNNGVFSEYNTTNSPLTTLNISGQGVDADDNLWIASGDFAGGNVIQKVTPDGTWTTYSSSEYPAIERPIGDFAFGLDGKVWVANDIVGALVFDGLTWTNPFIGNIDQVANYDVDAIEVDNTGKVYFSHSFGVTTLLADEWDDLLISDVPQQSSSAVTTIKFDDDGNLWWGSQRFGLFSLFIEGVSDVTSFNGLAFDFSVFPNPANDQTTIGATLGSATDVKAFIYNQLGQLQTSLNLGQLPAGTFQQPIDLSNLPKGCYTIRLQLGNKSSAKRVIVN